MSAAAREPATCPSAAPGTPPEVAVRFAIMMEESTLPKTYGENACILEKEPCLKGPL